ADYFRVDRTLRCKLVTPAKAGVQGKSSLAALDSRFRGNDGIKNAHPAIRAAEQELIAARGRLLRPCGAERVGPLRIEILGAAVEDAGLEVERRRIEVAPDIRRVLAGVDRLDRVPIGAAQPDHAAIGLREILLAAPRLLGR